MTSPRLAIHDRMVELADATRCRLLLALERQTLTVGELATALQLPQSTVSRHLKILADQDWIASRAEGASRWYRGTAMRDAESSALWELVRTALHRTPAVLQDAARIDAVIAARRAGTQAFFATASAEWDALRTTLFGARAELSTALAAVQATAAAETARAAATIAASEQRLRDAERATLAGDLDAAEHALDEAISAASS